MNLKSLYVGSGTFLLINIGSITNNTFLPMRYKFAYSWSIKIYSSQLESIFCILLVVEAFSLQKVIKTVEEMVASWQEVW